MGQSMQGETYGALMDLGIRERKLNPNIVRFLEILPGLRCRVRAPDGLTILILSIPVHLRSIYLEPGVFLMANVYLETFVDGEVEGEVMSKLETDDIAEFLSEGLWPSAFIEAKYISENMFKLLWRNSSHQL